MTLKSLILFLTLLGLTSQNFAASYRLFAPLSDNYSPDKIYIFGNNYQLLSDELSYKNTTFSLKGSIFYQNNIMQLSADELTIEKNRKRVKTVDSNYLFTNSKLNGFAEKLLLVSNVSSDIRGATISTCPINQNNSKQDWQLKADHIKMDYVNGWAKADSVIFLIKGIPIGYLPTFSFPIDNRRKSGLLFPDFTKTKIDGLTLKIPFYWNIANNMDYIGEVDSIDNRGVWMLGKIRHLSYSGYRELLFSGIKKDKLTKTDRYFAILKTTEKPSEHFSYQIDINEASDKQYLKDFESEFYKSDAEYLRKSVLATYQTNYFQAKIDTLEFQPLLNNSPKDYKVLPRIQLNYLPLDDINFKLVQTSFRSTEDNIKKTSGNRQMAEINIQHIFKNSYSQNTLGINAKAVQYNDMHNLDGAQTKNSATTYFLDSKLFLERDLSTNWTQTLEPRLYYAKRQQPNEDKVHLFDTSKNPTDLNLSSLFYYQTYDGNDRFGQLDRVSIGVGSKFIHKNKTTVSLNIAQGYDFFSKKNTNIIGEFSLNKEYWQANSSITLDSDTFNEIENTSSIKYEIDPKKLINASHKIKKSSKLDETQISTRFTLSSRWQTFAKFKWADGLFNERKIGVVYESCCWSVLGAFGQVAKNSDDTTINKVEYTDKFYLSFGLKGLASSRITEAINKIIR